MEHHHSEGIILSAIKYRDYDQISTLFTLEEGLIQLFIKRAYGKKEGYGTKCAPFVKAEHIYTKGRGDLYISHEISPLSFHLELRQTAERLAAAVALTQLVQQTQIPLKATPQLYHLFSHYLTALCTCDNPTHLTVSFRLKLMRHDGFFGVTPECSVCREPLCEHYLSKGESYCQMHAPEYAIHLDDAESVAFYTLAFSRSLQEISEVCCTPLLEIKIGAFADESCR